MSVLVVGVEARSDFCSPHQTQDLQEDKSGKLLDRHKKRQDKTCLGRVDRNSRSGSLASGKQSRYESPPPATTSGPLGLVSMSYFVSSR
mmetsp:Transcript_11865/g.27478  ORF Transcript_11865/g.27478 Transcript_11865/m.27478 type:complete len:89 (-) Transcript_11865:435-701(-)